LKKKKGKEREVRQGKKKGENLTPQSTTLDEVYGNNIVNFA
jgi:hypothetical protein